MGIPKYIQKYFWGDSIEDIDTNVHFRYISQTILEKGNIDSLHWLFRLYPAKLIETEIPHLKLSKKSSNYWKLYFS